MLGHAVSVGLQDLAFVLGHGVGVGLQDLRGCPMGGWWFSSIGEHTSTQYIELILEPQLLQKQTVVVKFVGFQ